MSVLKVLTACLVTANMVSSYRNTYLLDFGTSCKNGRAHVVGGIITVQGYKKYKLKCAPGRVIPLIGKNQSHVYHCHGKEMDKMPDRCVDKVFAYRKVGFQIRYKPKVHVDKLCEPSGINEFEKEYNNTVIRKRGLRSKYRFYKMYIEDCRRPFYSNDYVNLSVMLTHVYKRNNSDDYTSGGYAEIAFLAYQIIMDLMKKLDYVDSASSDSVQLVYNSNDAIKDYHCDSHVVLRIDDGEHICVGCGKGFWMNMVDRTCHPCGPGFYSFEHTAVACVPCPVQYKTSIWTADNINDCFYTKSKYEIFPRLIEAAVVPVIYLIILVAVVCLINKFCANQASLTVV